MMRMDLTGIPRLTKSCGHFPKILAISKAICIETMAKISHSVQRFVCAYMLDQIVLAILLMLAMVPTNVLAMLY